MIQLNDSVNIAATMCPIAPKASVSTAVKPEGRKIKQVIFETFVILKVLSFTGRIGSL